MYGTEHMWKSPQSLHLLVTVRYYRLLIRAIFSNITKFELKLNYRLLKNSQLFVCRLCILYIMINGWFNMSIREKREYDNRFGGFFRPVVSSWIKSLGDIHSKTERRIVFCETVERARYVGRRRITRLQVLCILSRFVPDCQASGSALALIIQVLH